MVNAWYALFCHTRTIMPTVIIYHNDEKRIIIVIVTVTILHACMTLYSFLTIPSTNEGCSQLRTSLDWSTTGNMW